MSPPLPVPPNKSEPLPSSRLVAIEDGAPGEVGGSPHDPARIRGDDLRRSMKWTLLAWIPGAFWMSATSGGTATILAKYLGATALWIALMNAAPQVGVMLQLPGAMLMERMGRRKGMFLWLGACHRFMYLVIGLLPWVLPADRVSSAALMVLALVISMCMGNLGGQAWVNWMADLIPPRLRGKFFGARGRAGLVIMIIVSVLLGLALDGVSSEAMKGVMGPLAKWGGMTPLICFISMVFIVSGAVGMLDILAFVWVDEAPMAAAPREKIITRLRQPLQDMQFVRFCGYWSLWTFAVSFANVFWWLYVLDFFEKDIKPDSAWMSHRYLMNFLMLPVGYWVGAALGYPIWGRAVDRFGRKPVLFVSSTLHTATWTFWLFLSPGLLPWMPLVQMVGGMLGSGQDIGSFNMMLQFNRKGGAGYQAVATILFSIAAFTAAFTSGKLLEMLDGFAWTVWTNTPWEHTFSKYSVMIAIAIVIKYGADLVLLPYVEDVKSRPRRETVRFVFENMYGSLNTVVFSPMQKGLEATGRQIVAVHEKVTEVAGEGIKRWFR